MVYSDYVKQRILVHHFNGIKSPTIQVMLRKEGIRTTRNGVYNFIKRYELTGSIGRRPGSGRRSKISEEIKRIVDEMMEEDDETSAYQIRQKLCAMGYNLSLRTILRCRKSLGWNYRGSAYCQMIRDVNKVKRLEWAKKHENDDFEDVIWTDESTIQMETHRRFCCRKQSQKPRYKPRSVK